ncbi:MAG: hypothetical protein WB661_09100 [Candidatus Bathyarchaeia archaeon]
MNSDSRAKTRCRLRERDCWIRHQEGDDSLRTRHQNTAEPILQYGSSAPITAQSTPISKSSALVIKKEANPEYAPRGGAPVKL